MGGYGLSLGSIGLSASVIDGGSVRNMCCLSCWWTISQTGVKLVVQTKAAVSHPAVCSFYLRSFFSRCWLTPLSLTSLFCPLISQSAHSVIHVEHHVVGILEYSRGAPLYRRTPTLQQKGSLWLFHLSPPQHSQCSCLIFSCPSKTFTRIRHDALFCFVICFLLLSR